MMLSTISSGDQFLHLLKCGVLQEEPDARLFPADGTDWQAIYDLASKQAVIGLVFWAVRRLPKELQPPRREVFLPWLSEIEMMYSHNERITSACLQVQKRFRKEGFRTCILKGQGVAALYPDPLLRMPGDIDLWVWPEEVPLGRKESLEERRARTLLYIRGVKPGEEVVYHHADFNVLKSVPLEVHFTPSWMNSPVRNWWLQRWFEKQAESAFNEDENLQVREASMHVPTVEFNAVYLLLHIFRHLFQEGIGLRQIVDYYYALQMWNNKREESKGSSDAAMHEALHKLGLVRFAGALMYVMQKLFSMPESMMLVPPREREGRELLTEILIAGNFGQYDTRFKHYDNGTFGAFYTRTLRNLKFFRSYPSEVLWTPVWKIGQYVWRRWQGYL